MKKKHLLTRKRARKIAKDPKKVRGFAELQQLAESYLTLLDVVEEQHATLEVMNIVVGCMVCGQHHPR